MQNVSTFYHILTFLGNFCNSDTLSVLTQQHVCLQNEHSKGFIEIKYAMILFKQQVKLKRRSKQSTYHVTKKNIAPSKVYR